MNGTIVGTAVWHMNLESELLLGATVTKKINLIPNWFQRIYKSNSITI